MKVRFSSIALLTIALSWTVLAQTQSPMRPGSWQVTMKMNMPGMGDMPPTRRPPPLESNNPISHLRYLDHGLLHRRDLTDVGRGRHSDELAGTMSQRGGLACSASGYG